MAINRPNEIIFSNGKTLPIDQYIKEKENIIKTREAKDIFKEESHRYSKCFPKSTARSVKMESKGSPKAKKIIYLLLTSTVPLSPIEISKKLGYDNRHELSSIISQVKRWIAYGSQDMFKIIPVAGKRSYKLFCKIDSVDKPTEWAETLYQEMLKFHRQYQRAKTPEIKPDSKDQVKNEKEQVSNISLHVPFDESPEMEIHLKIKISVEIVRD